jgi:protein-S-isoprenylcysteine O-methyltransferase Ste14
MDGLRFYLLCGLLAHKAVWMILQRRQRHAGASPTRPGSPLATLLKGVKTMILLGLVAQTFLPDVLPMLEDPRALRVIGVAAFSLGLTVAILGRVQLGDNWTDIEVGQVLKQQEVVSSGIYRYIRHPIYAGDLLLLLGFELALNSWLILGVAVMFPYIAWRAVREERVLSAVFPGYDSYCARTNRFVPFVI